MPVEIKELVIRAVINDAQSSTDIDSPMQSEGSNADNEALIKECVRQVMQLLARNKER